MAKKGISTYWIEKKYTTDLEVRVLVPLRLDEHQIDIKLKLGGFSPSHQSDSGNITECRFKYFQPRYVIIHNLGKVVFATRQLWLDYILNPDNVGSIKTWHGEYSSRYGLRKQLEI